jgi:hypothetical protein
MSQERFHLPRAHFPRVAFAMKQDEAFRPIHVSLFCTQAVMTRPHFPPYLIEQFWRRTRRVCLGIEKRRIGHEKRRVFRKEILLRLLAKQAELQGERLVFPGDEALGTGSSLALEPVVDTPEYAA